VSRRKITEPVTAPAELPELTEKEQKFANAILGGASPKEAFIAAGYTCTAGERSLVQMAGHVMNRPKMQQWISLARQAALDRSVMSLQEHLAQLVRLREMGVSQGNLGAAVQAEQLRGKAVGLYQDKVEMTVNDPTEALRSIAQISPELARKIARDHGISWPDGDTEH